MTISRRAARDEAGMTLPEVLVAMVITGIVTSGLLAGMTTMYRSFRYSDQDSSSLASLRTGLDRLEKEVRQARKMYVDSTSKRIHVWVDYDRDSQQDLVERVSWRIEDLGSDRAQLTRTTDAAPSEVGVVARGLVFDAGDADFAYNHADPSKATLVTVVLRANADGDVSEDRVVSTQVRLRNATF